jgi:predicted  nucleic acid-binding Zn ribbon protein
MKILDYSKLRPPRPTLKKDMCKCRGKRSIKLMASFLFWNPIHCIKCNLEISPESINLNQKLIDEIAYWASLYGAVDRLWFDSDEYEAWAKRELTNVKSRINKLGLSVNRSMNKIQKSYYWYFQDESDENFIAFEKCPKCKGKLIDYNNGIIKQKICERCLIIGSG